MRLSKEREDEIRECMLDYEDITINSASELFEEIDALRAENEKLQKFYDGWVGQTLDEQTEMEIYDEIRAAKLISGAEHTLHERIAKLRDFLTMKSRRSSYQWDEGNGGYSNVECFHEGEIHCANLALTLDDEMARGGK